MVVVEIELDAALKEGGNVILHFWASWCQLSTQMGIVFAHLSSHTPHARFFRVESEEQPEISELFGVSAVPLFVFIKDGIVFDKLEGSNLAELANKAIHLTASPSLNRVTVPEGLGMPSGPAVLEKAKDLSQQSGDVPNGTVTSTLTNMMEVQLQSLLNASPVMLFMKGTPQHPRCGFSRKVVDVLNELGAKYGSFDILTDDNVRKGVKKFSNWPTFPQLYCKGELLGGCDIVLEMHKSEELKGFLIEKGVLSQASPNRGVDNLTNDLATLGVLPEESKETCKVNIECRLKSLIISSPTVLFLKGTPDAPRCKFSSKVVTALREAGVTFGSFDILSDQEVRQGLKVYSKWPTFPQLYHNGELIGGCDIVLDMQKNGDLKMALAS